MIKNLHLVTGLILLLPNILFAAEERVVEPRYYLRGDLGFSKPADLNGSGYDNEGETNSLKRKFLYSIGAGYYYNQEIRVEVNFSQRHYKLRKSISPSIVSSQRTQDISTNVAMLSGYYDLRPYNNFRPYISCGIGVASHTAGALTEDSKITYTRYSKNIDYVLAWQVGVGIAVLLKDRLHMDVGYKFMNMGTARTTSGNSYDGNGIDLDLTAPPAKAKLKAHEFLVGVRYDF